MSSGYTQAAALSRFAMVQCSAGPSSASRASGGALRPCAAALPLRKGHLGSNVARSCALAFPSNKPSTCVSPTVARESRQETAARAGAHRRVSVVVVQAVLPLRTPRVPQSSSLLQPHGACAREPVAAHARGPAAALIAIRLTTGSLCAAAACPRLGRGPWPLMRRAALSARPTERDVASVRCAPAACPQAARQARAGAVERDGGGEDRRGVVRLRLRWHGDIHLGRAAEGRASPSPPRPPARHAAAAAACGLRTLLLQRWSTRRPMRARHAAAAVVLKRAKRVEGAEDMQAAEEYSAPARPPALPRARAALPAAPAPRPQ